LSVSNCREDENILLFPCGKKAISTRTNSMWLYSRMYLIWHPQDWRGAGSLNIPFVKQYLWWPKFLQVILFLCFFITDLVKNPLSYGAIMILWLVALPGFPFISGVSGIVNVMSLILPAAPRLLVLISVEAIIIAQ
jgi:hypothetical protein